MKRYLKNSVLNMRDIGGYETNDKKIIKQGLLIRSNCPNNLNAHDIESLKKIGIKNIIDLRNIEEIEKKPSSFANEDYFNKYYFEIIGGREIPKNSELVPVSYMNMLEQNAENIYKIFKLINSAEEGIIYYCNAGKDRTGVITALIQMLFNVDEKDIIADYLLSSVYLDDFLQEFIRKSNCEGLKEIIIPKQEFMQKFIEMFKQKYYSIENYLKSIGINEKEFLNIKNKYLI